RVEVAGGLFSRGETPVSRSSLGVQCANSRARDDEHLRFSASCDEHRRRGACFLLQGVPKLLSGGGIECHDAGGVGSAPLNDYGLFGGKRRRHKSVPCSLALELGF